MSKETVVTIEQAIKNEIAKFDPFEKRIIELKEQYGELTIVDINDREGYEAVRVAIGELRGIRTGTEKDKKVIKKPFWDACTTIEEKSKWIISEVSKIEDPLQKRKDEIDAEKEKIKQEKKQAQEKVFIQRSMQLSNMGVLFDGVDFVLEDARYEGVLVREADDDVYNEFILPKFKTIFDKYEAIRLEEEKVKSEQAEKEKTERENFARQQEELRQKEIEVEKQRLETERKERERIDAEEKEKNRVTKELQDKRFTELYPYNKFGDEVNMSTLHILAQSHFDEVLQTKKALFEKDKSEREEAEKLKKEIEIKQASEAAAKKERERIEEENRQSELKKQQELEHKAEELAKAGDKANWDAFIDKIKAISLPTLKSGQYRKISAISKEKIDEILKLKP